MAFPKFMIIFHISDFFLRQSLLSLKYSEENMLNGFPWLYNFYSKPYNTLSWTQREKKE